MTMKRLFLYQEWLQQKLDEYVHAPRPPQLRGRDVTMTPRQYGAALMQAYLGKASLVWIAEQTGISLETLRRWRHEPEFLLLMDWSKSSFAAASVETLILHDYSLTQYHDLAAEFALLDESLRVMTRVPLYDRFKRTGAALISKHENGIPLPDYDLRLFRRLFLFFLALEHHWPGADSRRLHEEFIPLARDVVWPLLKQEHWIEAALSSIQQSTPLSQIRLVLAGQLKQTFLRLPGE
jgi:hypothetical protein